MGKNKLISMIIILLLLLCSGIGIFYLVKGSNKKTKVFDTEMITNEALEYNNLFSIKCDNSKNLMAGDEVNCTVYLNPDLQNYYGIDDVLEYISFDYDLGNFLTLEDVVVESPNRVNAYKQFVLDKDSENKIILKNMNSRDLHKNVVCDDMNNCQVKGRSSYTITGSDKEVYVDSILDILFKFKFKISEDATFEDVINIYFPHVYVYSCQYSKNVENDVKNIYKINDLKVELKINQLKDDSEYKSNPVLYKVKTNLDAGTPVYIDYNKNFIGNKIESNKELDVIGDAINYTKNNRVGNFVFDNFRNQYYFLVRFDNRVGYVKYNDVSFIDNSVNYNNKMNGKKYYLSSDTELYNYPGLFGQSNEKIIPRGEIVLSNIYYNVGNANWLYVDYQGNKGWIVEVNNKNDYPYKNVLYGNASLIEEKSGKVRTDSKNYMLYKYAFSSEKVMDLPQNIELNYDYYVTLNDGIYYHVSYNDNQGWVKNS